MPNNEDLTNALRDVERLREAVNLAAAKFTEYAHHHAVKCHVEKAAANQELAALMREALAATDRNQQKEDGDDKPNPAI